jgi:serine/threonine protein kinase
MSRTVTTLPRGDEPGAGAAVTLPVPASAPARLALQAIADGDTLDGDDPDDGLGALSAAVTRDETGEVPLARERRTAPRPGTLLKSTYVLGARLGRGGMGEVFAAAHTRLKRRFAVKLLSRPSDSVEAIARFRREAEISSRLGHPNIVEVIDFDCSDDGQPFLVMELLAGEDLAARIERGPLPLATALRIAEQLGAALAAAHTEGIVHRDLKPQNVFLTRRGDDADWVKVLDFGISTIRGSGSGFTESQVVIGTPSYMAPEQAEGRLRDVDARADQFALGTLVYEMLDGTTPFRGESIPGVLYQVVHHRPPPLDQRVPGTPTHVARAVARAMAKDPAQRFSDVASFIAALRGDVAIPDIDPPPPALQPTFDDEPAPLPRRAGLYVALGLLAVSGTLGTFAVNRELERTPELIAAPVAAPRPAPPPQVMVNLASNPPADEILLDGAPVTAGSIYLPADGAEHLIVFRKSGFPDVTRGYRAIASGTLEVTFTPAPPPPPKKPRRR